MPLAYEQQLFRFYNDDGSESAATAYAAQNTSLNPTLTGNLSLTLRANISVTGAGGTVAQAWHLQYRKNGGTWTNITTSTSNVKAFDSTNLTDAGATTNRLTGGTGTFQAGLVSETGQLGDGFTTYAIGTGKQTEFLTAITLVSADLANGDVLEFRYDGATPITYTVTPTVTIGSAGGGGGGTGLPWPPLPAPTVSESSGSSSSGKNCSGKIRITDHTGRLSRNPAHWPENLKKAIAECCCCVDSTTASSPGQVYADPCCIGKYLPETLRGNIRNTKTHDTGMTLRYWPMTVVKFGFFNGLGPTETYPPWIPKNALPYLSSNAQFPSVFRWGPVWYSDFFFDYECNYDLSGFFYQQISQWFNTRVDYRIVMNVQVYYYAMLGYPDIANSVNNAPTCHFRLLQCAYPTGTIYYTPQFGAPYTQPIDYHLNNGGPGVIGANLINFLTKTETSVVASAGDNVYPFSDYYCTGFHALVCNPTWRRLHMFQGYPKPGGVAGVTLDTPKGIYAQCLQLQAERSDQSNRFGGAATKLALPEITADDLENFVRCDKPVFDESTDPFMEAFI